MDDYAYSTAFNLTPEPDNGEQIAALLAPAANPMLDENIVQVSFKECNFVSCENDQTVFDLVFSVYFIPKDSQQTTKMVNISRRVVVNNSSIGSEALDNIASKKTIFVETKQQKDDAARRMRELAGIPHKGNFV